MISKQLRTKLCEGTVMKNLKEDKVKKGLNDSRKGTASESTNADGLIRQGQKLLCTVL